MTNNWDNTNNLMKYVDSHFQLKLIKFLKTVKLYDQEELTELENIIISKTKLNSEIKLDQFTEKFKELMLKLNNQVYLERPNHLSHHRPELAAPHLAALLKKFLEGKNIF